MTTRWFVQASVLALCVLLSACWGPTEIKDPESAADVISGLTISAAIEASADSLHGVVVIRNPAGDAVKFGLNRFSCGLILRLYSTAGDLLWNQARDMPIRPGGCKWIPTTTTLARGDSIRVDTEEVPREALERALSPGSYSSTITVIFARMVSLGEAAYTTRIDSVMAIPAGNVLVER